MIPSRFNKTLVGSLQLQACSSNFIGPERVVVAPVVGEIGSKCLNGFLERGSLRKKVKRFVLDEIRAVLDRNLKDQRSRERQRATLVDEGCQRKGFGPSRRWSGRTK